MSQDGRVSADDPLEQSQLTFLLGMGFQLVLVEFVRRLDAQGYAEIRPMHGLVFQALRGPGLTSTELAQVLGVTKQAAGQIVNDLEDKGYVARTTHPSGGRRKLIVLTEKAHTHLAVAGRTLHALESELAEKLGDPELASLRAEVAGLIRAMAGESVPPLRPIW
jgi:DNA-binding MarR family transcriptional regulator